MNLFPNGWWPYLAGGLLVGAGIGGIFLTTGLRAGASSFFTTTWSWLSRHDYFQRPVFRDARTWRLAFTLGLLVGASLFAARSPQDFVTRVAPWRLLVGGLLVGFGTRLSRGCTSGHGICGISAGSKPSLLAVLVFMAVAILVAHAMRAAGVTP
ncbi:MAG: YeeE/YedE family protein [bacterium]|nr:YeeE/YedE family protein [bacterium]